MTEHTEKSNDGNAPTPAIGWQLAMAFGQGVGGSMMATQPALILAFENYGHGLQSDSAWPAKRLAALEFARMLGRLAAGHAVHENRCVIDVVDVTFALEGVRTTHPEPLGGCPITNRFPPYHT